MKGNKNLSIQAEVMSANEALLKIGDQKVILDYDKAYELAFQLAHLIQQMGQRDEGVVYH